MRLSGSIKLIHVVSAGIDHFVLHPTIQNTAIPITTSSGIHAPPIAEWCVLNWIASARNFAHRYESQKQRRWGDVEEYLPTVSDQVGRRVGILGYGSIGRQSALSYYYTRRS